MTNFQQKVIFVAMPLGRAHSETKLFLYQKRNLGLGRALVMANAKMKL